MLKGIRGAITVERNDRQDIEQATTALLQELLNRNQISIHQIAAAIFTATADLTAAYPAVAARTLGFDTVPLMCMQEMKVEGSLPQCIRVLLLLEHELQTDVKHVYLEGASVLRPDLAR